MQAGPSSTHGFRTVHYGLKGALLVSALVACLRWSLTDLDECVDMDQDALDHVLAHLRASDLLALRSCCRTLRARLAFLASVTEASVRHGPSHIHLPLAQQLRSLRVLHVEEPASLAPLVSHILGRRHLRRISLSSPQAWSSPSVYDLQPLSSLSALEELVLHGDRYRSLQLLTQIRRVEFLGAPAIHIRPELRPFSCLTRLRELGLRHSFDANLGVLTQLSRLEVQGFVTEHELCRLTGLRALELAEQTCQFFHRTGAAQIVECHLTELQLLSSLKYSLGRSGGLEGYRLDLAGLPSPQCLTLTGLGGELEIASPSVSSISLSFAGSASQELPIVSACPSLEHLTIAAGSEITCVGVASEALPSRTVTLSVARQQQLDVQPGCQLQLQYSE